jgi:uncharacterized protein YecE (DUF72 family)
MDFGKLPSVEHVSFAFQPEPPGNAEILTNAPKAAQPLIYIGATGYNMKAWTGRWYPEQAKEKDFLRHYGHQFNTIEHNTTHYRIPDTSTVQRWKEETPEDFRFCPKIPQTISHSRDLGLHSGEIRLFCDVIRGLGHKMGCCFLQLPPYWAVRDIPVLMRFLETWPVDIPLSVEVRHESFFQQSTGAEDYFQLLTEHSIPAVITDVSGRRDVCHLRLTTSVTLIRFVGNALHRTDYERIQAWSLQIQKWVEAGLSTVYFFTHEPDNLLAPDLAQFTFDTFTKDIPKAIMRGPRPIVRAVQGSLF